MPKYQALALSSSGSEGRGGEDMMRRLDPEGEIARGAHVHSCRFPENSPAGRCSSRVTSISRMVQGGHRLAGGAGAEGGSARGHVFVMYEQCDDGSYEFTVSCRPR